MNYEECEIECEKIRKSNKKYIETFQLELVKKNLSEKTIQSHLENVDLYINDFLLYSEPIMVEDGCRQVSEFLGYYFIRKCMWSTPASIKSTASSLKKFYKCMSVNGIITEVDYKQLCETIKDNMEIWQADCRQFDDMDQESPFAYF